jgi:predicted transcriptional regulator
MPILSAMMMSRLNVETRVDGKLNQAKAGGLGKRQNVTSAAVFMPDRAIRAGRLNGVPSRRQLKVAKFASIHQTLSMTDKQTVLDAVQRLPESASLNQIAEELRIMSAIRSGREDVAAGRVKSHAEVEQLMKSWASQWSAK